MRSRKTVLFSKDNGLGIDMQKRSNEIVGLHKRFHKDQAERKEWSIYGENAGWNLWGAEISITSKVNKGTEFKTEFTINRSRC